MTDREQLELASKACGLEEAKMRIEFNQWNPLEDDGDALRLAVKLGLILGTYAHYVTVDLLSPNDRIETITVWHSQTNDPYAATRRAIVRAAAEIGRSMK
ncbi:hypothetical protein UFOVP662_23 [uncultured Caudovirales phage]|uniref:Uncharacterized protein n=1 Tax=uncultured Caudovirales phage TaxID=2100421 RepID=A0A6J5QNT5_9CAUD|nr:hypothetical protein UFOVP662_23 [uncultured Caudovirales phage]CAB4181224.1 hypothetical protein UFOVP1067_23 [uncultured Caudovirales phage]